MKQESTHEDQEELQRMLARKRGEQPSQRFFKGLSTAVIDRLQHPEPPPAPTLLQKLGLDFERKTVVICVSAVGVCGLLSYAWVSSQNVKAPPPTAPVGAKTLPYLAVQSGAQPIDAMPPVQAPGSQLASTNGDLLIRAWPRSAAPPDTEK